MRIFSWQSTFTYSGAISPTFYCTQNGFCLVEIDSQGPNVNNICQLTVTKSLYFMYFSI